MGNQRIRAAALWLIVLAPAVAAAGRPGSSNDETAIRQAVEAHCTRFNARDLEAIRSELSDDVVALLDQTNTISGRDAFVAVFKEEFEQFAAAGASLSLSAVVDEALARDDWGFARGTFTVTFSRASSHVRSPVRFLLVFRRQPDRSWKLARFMNNRPAAPAPPRSEMAVPSKPKGEGS